MSLTVDGLDELIGSLDAAGLRAVPAVRAVVSKGALQVKTDWRRRWSGMRHAPALPAAITYDVTASRSTVRAVVGPDKRRAQGALGNLIEYGSIHNAPRPAGRPALDDEEPRFVAALAALAGSVLG